MVASGFAKEILQAIPNRIAVAREVWNELKAGHRKSYNDAHQINKLRVCGIIEIIPHGVVGEAHFEDLVIGPATGTLDDGEAATIASAIEHKGIALIDERKANRICREKYPNLLTACSIDLFAHPIVSRLLGQRNLVSSVLNALTNARMRVMAHHIDWVSQLVGADKLSGCNSLPRAARIHIEKGSH